MFSLLPFAAFVKRFSAKNETDARKRGFHPPARRVFPQKSSDNALSDLSRLFFQALDTDKSDLSLSSAKKRKSKTSVGSIFRCAPRPPTFQTGSADACKTVSLFGESAKRDRDKSAASASSSVRAFSRREISAFIARFNLS